MQYETMTKLTYASSYCKFHEYKFNHRFVHTCHEMNIKIFVLSYILKVHYSIINTIIQ